MQVQYVYPMGAGGWTRIVNQDFVPPKGMEIEGPDGETYIVDNSIYYPWGDHEDDSNDPSAYVILRTPEQIARRL